MGLRKNLEPCTRTSWRDRGRRSLAGIDRRRPAALVLASLFLSRAIFARRSDKRVINKRLFSLLSGEVTSFPRVVAFNDSR